MNKGVESPLSGELIGKSGAAGAGARLTPAPQVDGEIDERIIRRRRRNRRHSNRAYRSGRGREIIIVTVLAIAVLFAALYFLLPHDQASHEESRLGAAPAQWLATARPTSASVGASASASAWAQTSASSA
jgi:hypothetical protein